MTTLNDEELRLLVRVKALINFQFQLLKELAALDSSTEERARAYDEKWRLATRIQGVIHAAAILSPTNAVLQRSVSNLADSIDTPWRYYDWTEFREEEMDQALYVFGVTAWSELEVVGIFHTSQRFLVRPKREQAR